MFFGRQLSRAAVGGHLGLPESGLDREGDLGQLNSDISAQKGVKCCM